MRTIFLFLISLNVSSLGLAQETIVINTNGSFENTELSNQADTLEIEGWVIETAEAATANYAIVSDTVKDGSRALRVDVVSLGNNDWDIQVINELFPVKPGIQYTFSIWARASAVGIINFTAGNPSFNEFGRVNNAEINETWQEYSFTFSVGVDDSEGRTPLHFNLAGNEGIRFWIDSLQVSYESTEPEFEPIARDKPKFLGNIYASSQNARFTEYWNQVTPENAGKWGSVEGVRDQMNWTELDAAYTLAKANNFPFRFHVLIWGNQQPEWLKTLSSEEQLEEIEEWMSAVAERYPDIDYLEVVNEPLHDPPTDDPEDAQSGGYFEALGGAGSTGWDWVITAFEMADSIFADSVALMINDFNILGNVSNTSTYLDIIELLQERELIDVIGMQGHHFSTKFSTTSNIRTVLRNLSETGLPLMVTELDINGFSNNNSAAAQLSEYQRVFPLVWEHESVIGVTLWGWRPGLWVSDALLIENNGNERPSMVWLRDYVESTEVSITSNQEALLVNDTPTEIQLNQNYPNPFNPATSISFYLPRALQVSLSIYDINGRLIETVLEERLSAGNHQISFEAKHLASGVYVYMLDAGGIRQTQKMMLIK